MSDPGSMFGPPVGFNAQGVMTPFTSFNGQGDPVPWSFNQRGDVIPFEFTRSTPTGDPMPFVFDGSGNRIPNVNEVFPRVDHIRNAYAASLAGTVSIPTPRASAVPTPARNVLSAAATSSVSRRSPLELEPSTGFRSRRLTTVIAAVCVLGAVAASYLVVWRARYEWVPNPPSWLPRPPNWMPDVLFTSTWPWAEVALGVLAVAPGLWLLGRLLPVVVSAQFVGAGVAAYLVVWRARYEWVPNPPSWLPRPPNWMPDVLFTSTWPWAEIALGVLATVVAVEAGRRLVDDW